jgi:hypothetical protein
MCRACGDEHLRQEHKVAPIDVAAAEAATAITAGLPVLREGLAHQVSLAAAHREQLEVLASRRAVAVEALEAATARLHAAVDAKRAVLLADIQAAYDAKVAAVHAGVAVARAAAAELATVAATAEAGLAETANATMRVHVAGSVRASLDLARRRDEMGADVATLGFEGACEEEVAAVRLGRIVTDSGKAASAAQVSGTYRGWYYDARQAGSKQARCVYGGGYCRRVHRRCLGVWRWTPWCRYQP